MKVLSIRNTTFFTGTKTDPVNRRYKASNIAKWPNCAKRPGKSVDLRSRPLISELSMTSYSPYQTSPLLIPDYENKQWMKEVTWGAVNDVTSKSRSFPQVDRTDFKVSNFPALYLRLTGSVFVPVKNVEFLMLRTFTRLSILNHWSFPLRKN